VHLNGKAVNGGRYLGPMLDSYGDPMYEVRQRCRAARVALRRVGGRFWSAPLPRRLRRSRFAAFIQGNLFSGMKSFTLDQRHYKKMDSVTQQLLKKTDAGQSGDVEGRRREVKSVRKLGPLQKPEVERVVERAMLMGK